MTFLLGIFIGTAVGIFIAGALAAGSRSDDDATILRRGYLLDQARRALERYGESRHLADTIRRELDDEAGA